MYKLTLLLIPLIFLSSCTIDWNDEKDAKITSLNAKIEELSKKIEEQESATKKAQADGLFKKKQECSEYTKQEAESVLEDVNWLYTDNFEIFYSSKTNSCIKYMERHFKNFTTFRIDDILTNKNILLCMTNELTSCKTDANNKLIELKWE